MLDALLRSIYKVWEVFQEKLYYMQLQIIQINTRLIILANCKTVVKKLSIANMLDKKSKFEITKSYTALGCKDSIPLLRCSFQCKPK